jgi:hypothetical protein
MYLNVKMIPIETILGMGRGEIKESVERVNSSTIYLIHSKSFCKCHNVCSTQHNNKKNK